LSKLVRGEVIQYPVTIPEGYNMFQVADVLDQAKVCRKKAFLDKAADAALIKSLGFEEETLEGYLFPDTYNFPKGYGEEHVIRQMVSRFKAVFGTLAPKAASMGLSRKEVVILASIIEKEAMDDGERSLISAVFHNRLTRGMALQSDPTAIYGVKDPSDSRVTRDDLQRKTPYNTYMISGLPKGPISNPGLRSLQAVLNPANVDYVFFVSKNDGTHHFSSTIQEHNRAVANYQRRPRS
ncbi:MAG TPA: endolytic transglycosylase MltG, partial [Thermodesulfobacteriota bacterium]|nr:endolytic transglycosylase MltG [Thermodesulfobacteriota bacterium]